MPCIEVKNGFVCVSGNHKPGDQPPNGYIDRQEWHKVQQKAGYQQSKCGVCGKYCYSQELSDKKIIERYSLTKHGPEFKRVVSVCNKCVNKAHLDSIKEIDV